MVAIPHSDFTDNRVLRTSPRNFFQVYKDTFDYLYRTEPNGMINLTFHAHFGGRVVPESAKLRLSSAF